MEKMEKNLTVTQYTTLDDLSQFLNGANNQEKVLGRRDSQGNTVLYLGSDSPKVRDRIISLVNGHESRARKGIQSIFKNTLADKSEAAEVLLNHAGNTLKAQSYQRGGIYVGQLKAATTTTAEIVRQLPEGTATPALLPKGPTLGSIGMTREAVVARSKNSSADLGQAIAEAFLKKKPDDAARQAFAFSGAMALKTELKDALKAVSPSKSDQFIQNAVNVAACQMFPEDIVDDQSSIKDLKGKTITLPHINIEGSEYKPSRQLGTGGFADVYEYIKVVDPDSKIAFKISKVEMGEKIQKAAVKIDQAAREIDIHQLACGKGKGCDQVLGIKSAIRLPDGNVGIAMEMAPHGTVDEMAEMISSELKQGTITKEQANVLRLTMLKDMALGLRHMHEKQGITHYDFKSPNCLIGAGGVVKVADFGLSMKNVNDKGKSRLIDAGAVDNPYYKAPELMRAEGKAQGLDKRARDATRNLGQETWLEELLPNATPETISALKKSVMADRRLKIESDKLDAKSRLFFGREVDIWGLGASALEIFTGHPPFKLEQFNPIELEAHIVAFFKNTPEPLSDPDKSGKPKNGSAGLKTENHEINDFLTFMLQPKPENRATATEIINHQIMKTNSVGSLEAKALIAALHSKDQVLITRARKDLSDAMFIKSVAG